MTLKDLKKRVPVADEKKVILRKKELLNTGAEIVVKEIIEDGVEISVYDNGYVLYEEGRHRTVFRLHECKDYDYSAVDGRKDAFGADFFQNENWYILPLMVGMDRVEDSRRRILSNHKVISIDIEENDFFSIKARCVPDMTEKVLWNEMMREISDLLNEAKPAVQADTPKTGDESNMKLWLLLLGIGAGGLGVAFGIRRKRK